MKNFIVTTVRKPDSEIELLAQNSSPAQIFRSSSVTRRFFCNEGFDMKNFIVTTVRKPDSEIEQLAAEVSAKLGNKFVVRADFLQRRL